MNAAPLVQRILSDASIPAWHNAPAELKDMQAPLLECCKKYGVALSDVAIRYAIDHPFIASTIIGMCDQGNVKKNAGVVEFSIPEGLLDEINQLVAPVKNTMWFEGMPENNVSRKNP